MKYGSVCSGIEAATVAWGPLGWSAQWFSEIEDVPCSILAHHYPDVPNLGDMTKIHEQEVFVERPIELLVGGTPCQSFSVAGLRKGLADPRGNLALHFLKIADAKRPRWICWENVPGVLSSWSDEEGSFKADPDGASRGLGAGMSGDEGAEGPRGEWERGWQTNDFDTFLCGLRELGYGVAWRICDAQFFGIPQRRRRVFVVGYFGDWRPAAAVLFERHGLSGNPPPSRKKGQGAAAVDQGPIGGGGQPGVPEIAETLRSGSTSPASHGKLNGTDRMTLVPTVMAHGQANAEIREDASPSLTCNHEAPIVAHTLRGEGFDASEDGTGRGTPLVAVFENHAQDSRIKEVSVVPALSAKAGTGGNNLPLVSTPAPVDFESRIARNGRGAPDEVVPPLKAQSGENGTGDGAPLIAYTTKLENTQSNQSGKVYEEYAPRVSRNSAALMTSASVRRLTPRECERLQGFPDDWTLVKHGKKLTADGPRYKALGNSMAVPVMSWIGRRIQIVDDMLKELRG